MEYFVDLIRKEFAKDAAVTINELFSTLSKDSEVKIEPHKLKHRIRSAVYWLKENKEISRIRYSTYQKVKIKTQYTTKF